MIGKARLQRALNIDDLRAWARRRLPHGLFEFIDRGAEDDLTLRRNRVMLDQLALCPRVLSDVSSRSQEVVLFGRRQASPLVVGPTGGTGLIWYKGERELAKAAGRAGVPYTLSTASITSMEEVSEVEGTELWFQLYMYPDRSLSDELIDRAARLGFQALVVTVDNAAAPNREYNIRNGASFPMRASTRNVLSALTHPRWACNSILRYRFRSEPLALANVPRALQQGLTKQSIAFPRTDSLSWDDLKAIRRRWSGPLIVKGIMSTQDAVNAADHGADGIVVSNHGGRSLDSAPASIAALGPIANRVGERATILFDGGTRRGSDIAKAIVLGADAVLLGRAPLWGLAVAGQEGAFHALELLKSELSRVLALTGSRSLAELRLEQQRLQKERGSPSPNVAM